MNALQQAVADRHPGATVVDQDEHSAYLSISGKRGVHRVRFSTGPGGIRLGQVERMRPARTTDRLARLSVQVASLERQIAARPAKLHDDYAAVLPSSWTPPAGGPRAYQAPVQLAAPGGGDDYAPVTPNSAWSGKVTSPWSDWPPTGDSPPLPAAITPPAVASFYDDYAMVEPSTWGKRS